MWLVVVVELEVEVEVEDKEEEEQDKTKMLLDRTNNTTGLSCMKAVSISS